MIQYLVRRSINETFQKVATPPANSVWVIGSKITKIELIEIADSYDLDINILRDVLDKHELPRVESNKSGLYVFIRSAHRSSNGDLITVPLLLAIKGSIFLSLSTNDNSSKFNFLLNKVDKHSTTSSLLLTILATVVSDYEQLIQNTATYINDIDRRLRTHEVTNADFIQFVSIDANLNEYHMNLTNMLVVAERLRDMTKSSVDRELIGDITLHIRQNLAASERYNQNVNSIRSTYSTIANNNLNKRMKILTVLTVLITLPNVFYGMYGMNIILPFQDQPWAYQIIVGFTLLLILLVYLLARRFKVL